MKTEKLVLLGGLAAFIYWEFFGSQSAVPAQTVSTPANALGVPTAPINASTLSPAQLGSGLFENASGLQSSPGDVYASE